MQTPRRLRILSLRVGGWGEDEDEEDEEEKRMAQGALSYVQLSYRGDVCGCVCMYVCAYACMCMYVYVLETNLDEFLGRDPAVQSGIGKGPSGWEGVAQGTLRRRRRRRRR